MSFSIVVPVYNCEKYLEQTINSVLSQNYYDYELLLIDDGSNKETYEICEKYAKNNSVKVYHNSNHGVSYTRNFGIKKATKEYVLFLDGDDYWDDNELLAKLTKLVKGKDVVLFGYQYLNDGNFINKSNFDLCDLTNLKDLMDCVLFTSSCCLKAVKRELLINHNLYFIENMYVEDIEWNFHLAMIIENFDVLAESPYIYRVVKESRSKTFNYQKVEDYCKAIELCVGYAEKYNKNNLLGYVSYNYAILMGRLNGYKELKNKMIKYRYLLDHSNNNKVKKVKTLTKLVGFNFACKIINVVLDK